MMNELQRFGIGYDLARKLIWALNTHNIVDDVKNTNWIVKCTKGSLRPLTHKNVAARVFCFVPVK